MDTITKIKNHPFYACLGALFLIGFLFFVYTHPLMTDGQREVRLVLPQIAPSTEALTLITEPEQGIGSILEMISNSKSSIDLVMYEFKDKGIADALIDAEKRGVSVRVILNGGYKGKIESMNEPAYQYLESSGVSVHFAPSYFALTHQKTLIVDKNQAMIMTFNFTPKY